jgi:hypothetical protein
VASVLAALWHHYSCSSSNNSINNNISNNNNKEVEEEEADVDSATETETVVDSVRAVLASTTVTTWGGTQLKSTKRDSILPCGRLV